MIQSPNDTKKKAQDKNTQQEHEPPRQQIFPVPDVHLGQFLKYLLTFRGKKRQAGPHFVNDPGPFFR